MLRQGCAGICHGPAHKQKLAFRKSVRDFPVLVCAVNNPSATAAPTRGAAPAGDRGRRDARGWGPAAPSCGSPRKGRALWGCLCALTYRRSRAAAGSLCGEEPGAQRALGPFGGRFSVWAQAAAVSRPVSRLFSFALKSTFCARLLLRSPPLVLSQSPQSPLLPYSGPRGCCSSSSLPWGGPTSHSEWGGFLHGCQRG